MSGFPRDEGVFPSSFSSPDSSISIEGTAGAITLEINGTTISIANFGNYAGTTPATTVGANGDYAYDISNGNIWGPKVTGSWTGTLIAQAVQFVAAGDGELPATAGTHLTTQGGSTLDDGSGNLEVLTSLGVGTTPNGTAGHINATGSISTTGTVFAGSVDSGAFAVNTSSGGTLTAAGYTNTVPTPSSGGAFTPNANTDCELYLQLAGAATGSYSITLGPTTGAEHSVFTSVSLVATQTAAVTVRVPNNWKVVLTLTNATLTQIRAASC